MPCSNGMHEDADGTYPCGGCDYYEDAECACCSKRTDELTAYSEHLLCAPCLKAAVVEDALPLSVETERLA